MATWAGFIDNMVMWKNDASLQIPIILYCRETVHSVYFVTHPGVSCSVRSVSLSLSLCVRACVRISLLHGFISRDLKSFPNHPMFYLLRLLLYIGVNRIWSELIHLPV